MLKIQSKGENNLDNNKEEFNNNNNALIGKNLRRNGSLDGKKNIFLKPITIILIKKNIL